MERRINASHKAINKPLTILGAERKLFFVVLIMGASAFNLFGSLLGGILLFGCLFLLAQWATRGACSGWSCAMPLFGGYGSGLRRDWLSASHAPAGQSAF